MSVWTQKASKKGDGKDFPKVPPGNHPAVLVGLVDMGTQKNEYGNEVTWQRRAYFCWELTDEEVPGYKGRNFVIGIDLTISMNEKAKLKKWVESRLGKQIGEGVEYDISKELGQKCLLNVSMKGEYPRVDGMSAVPKGLPVPDARIKPFLFSLDDIPDDGNFTLPDWLPYHYGEKLVDVVKRCKELAGEGAEPAGVGGGGESESPGSAEDIPF